MMEQKREIQIPNELIGNIFGELDVNIRNLEKLLTVVITNRGENIILSGSLDNTEKAESVIQVLISVAQKGEKIDDQKINYIVGSMGESDINEVEKLSNDIVCMTISGKQIRPKTLGQKRYIEQIKKNTIVFGVGPAGTGKTYLGMAMAITAFKKNEVNRIILTRPAIEAGEKLGFLPGDLQQKVDPYLRPLYDALHEIMGAESFLKNMEKGLIEVAPLAYMRGRTLDNSFIVLDEAQNTTPEQMKMFLTRLGFGSKIVITGDVTQIDLPDGKTSGLVEVLKILNNVEDIGITKFTNKDVVRHPLVQKIVSAYESHEALKRKTIKSRR